MKHNVEIYIKEKTKSVGVNTFDKEIFKLILDEVTFEDINKIEYCKNGFATPTIEFKIDDKRRAFDIISTIKYAYIDDIKDQLDVLNLCGVTPVTYDGERIIGYADEQLLVFKNGEIIHKEPIKRLRYYKYGCRGIKKDGVMQLEVLTGEALYNFIYEMFAYNQLLQMDWIYKTDQVEYIKKQLSRADINEISKLRVIKY